MAEQELNGDHFLSGNDRLIWSIHQDVLFRWGVYCIFKHTRINVPKGQAEMIEFFVPRDTTFRYEIIKHLEHELGALASDPIPAEDSGFEHGWPGTKVMVRIMPFKGIDFHTPRDVVEKIAEEAVKNFHNAVEQHRKKKKQD